MEKELILELERKKGYSIEQLKIPSLIKSILAKMNIRTVGELIETKPELLKVAFENTVETLHWFEYLKSFIHSWGLNFVDDYEELNLPLEIVNTPIRALDMPVVVKNIFLRRTFIYNLGDLLSTDYNTIMNIRGMGPHNMNLLMEYLESLGYTLKNEESLISMPEENLAGGRK